MPDKPLFAHDYTKENVELVRQTCLLRSSGLFVLLTINEFLAKSINKILNWIGHVITQIIESAGG
jgi:hypothetical protein